MRVCQISFVYSDFPFILQIFSFNEGQRWTVLGDENIGWVKMESDRDRRGSVVGAFISTDLPAAPDKLMKLMKGPFGKW